MKKQLRALYESVTIENIHKKKVGFSSLRYSLMLKWLSYPISNTHIHTIHLNALFSCLKMSQLMTIGLSRSFIVQWTHQFPSILSNMRFDYHWDHLFQISHDSIWSFLNSVDFDRFGVGTG